MLRTLSEECFEIMWKKREASNSEKGAGLLLSLWYKNHVGDENLTLCYNLLASKSRYQCQMSDLHGYISESWCIQLRKRFTAVSVKNPVTDHHDRNLSLRFVYSLLHHFMTLSPRDFFSKLFQLLQTFFSSQIHYPVRTVSLVPLVTVDSATSYLRTSPF